mmetsp:Transcript_5380/g.16060  ORF Transcript_5380/g.16060 Transcript_5380/m.16060 type:complete len:201 (-) Transcript_5380:308-910(-)
MSHICDMKSPAGRRRLERTLESSASRGLSSCWPTFVSVTLTGFAALSSDRKICCGGVVVEALRAEPKFGLGGGLCAEPVLGLAISTCPDDLCRGISCPAGLANPGVFCCAYLSGSVCNRDPLETLAAFLLCKRLSIVDQGAVPAVETSPSCVETERCGQGRSCLFVPKPLGRFCSSCDVSLRSAARKSNHGSVCRLADAL